MYFEIALTHERSKKYHLKCFLPIHDFHAFLFNVDVESKPWTDQRKVVDQIKSVITSNAEIASLLAIREKKVISLQSLDPNNLTKWKGDDHGALCHVKSHSAPRLVYVSQKNGQTSLKFRLDQLHDVVSHIISLADLRTTSDYFSLWLLPICTNEMGTLFSVGINVDNQMFYSDIVDCAHCKFANFYSEPERMYWKNYGSGQSSGREGGRGEQGKREHGRAGGGRGWKGNGGQSWGEGEGKERGGGEDRRKEKYGKRGRGR
jgi:hypothetical protein